MHQIEEEEEQDFKYSRVRISVRALYGFGFFTAYLSTSCWRFYLSSLYSCEKERTFRYQGSICIWSAFIGNFGTHEYRRITRGYTCWSEYEYLNKFRFFMKQNVIQVGYTLPSSDSSQKKDMRRWWAHDMAFKLFPPWEPVSDQLLSGNWGIIVGVQQALSLLKVTTSKSRANDEPMRMKLSWPAW